MKLRPKGPRDVMTDVHMAQCGNNTYMCTAIRFPGISKKIHIPTPLFVKPIFSTK
jgi:hypothetical protein